jgi:hypothetical protein
MFTRESLILGDLDNEKCSEISWKQTNQEKFDFSNQEMIDFISGKFNQWNFCLAKVIL